MPLRTARQQTETGADPPATRVSAARAPLPVVARPALPGNLPPLAALRRASLLQLQHAVGNAAVAGGVAALAGTPAASVQRCGSIPPDECPCDAEDASAEVERPSAENVQNLKARRRRGHCCIHMATMSSSSSGRSRSSTILSFGFP